MLDHGNDAVSEKLRYAWIKIPREVPVGRGIQPVPFEDQIRRLVRVQPLSGSPHIDPFYLVLKLESELTERNRNSEIDRGRLLFYEHPEQFPGTDFFVPLVRQA